MIKKVFFQEINRVTPSVAAPGDTNPSDATVIPLTFTSFAQSGILIV